MSEDIIINNSCGILPGTQAIIDLINPYESQHEVIYHIDDECMTASLFVD